MTFCWIIVQITLYSKSLSCFRELHVMPNLLKSGILAGLFAVFFPIIAFSGSVSSGKSAPQASEAALKAGQKPIVVNTIHVTAQDIPKIINALGGLSATQKVVISPETSGLISTINFKSGQQVTKGMPIVLLGNQQAKADYQASVTQYQLALQKYERSSKLLADGAISEQSLAVLKATVATDQADVQSKLADLNEKRVVAPFTGTLGAFQVHEGAYVNAGDPLVTLVNTQNLRADYNIPEKYMPEIKVGQSVNVTTGAYSKKTFYGTVTFVSPIVSATSRMVAVQAAVDNSEDYLSPGMFVHLTQNVGSIKNAVVVPSQTVSADVKGYYVYKVLGDRVIRQAVTVGMQVADQTQILSGLSIGDQIVSAGQQKLEDGSLIKIVQGS